MKVLTIYSDSHIFLYENFFKPSFDRFLSSETLLPVKTIQNGSGIYETDGFDLTMVEKIKTIIESIEVGSNKLFVYSDCDIQFFGRPDFENNMSNYDIMFQMDNDFTYCAGFFVCKQTKNVKSFFELVLSELLLSLNGKIHDQIIINKLINTKKSYLSIGRLDRNKYWTIANYTGGVWNGSIDFKVPENILVHHANWTIGTDNKIKLLNEVRLKAGFSKYYSNLNVERMAGGGSQIIDGASVNTLHGLNLLCEKYLTKESNVLEFGVNDGVSTSLFAEYSNHVTAVDIHKTKALDSLLLETQNITFHQMFFEKFSSDTFFDLIYIDGDHSYESVKKDILISLPLLKNGGVLSGHDFNSQTPGVKMAVNELLGIYIELFPDSSWAVIKNDV